MAVIGIRKETKDKTERRAPLTPRQVQTLIKEHNIEVMVEPSETRYFNDSEYQAVGAKITADLSSANIIFGVKEVPIPDLIGGKAFCFFSHTIKGQDYNMPMLKQILDLRISLLDYEKVTDAKGRRLIFFGRYAGYAGMIDTLWALGRRLATEGLITPFSEIKQALNYESLKEAKEAIAEVGKKIIKDGLASELQPFVCGFTGYGQVSQGAQEVLDMLPVEEISPLELFDPKRQYSAHKVYKVVFKEEHLVRRTDSSKPFDLQEYYHNLEKYQSDFEKYLPHLSVLVNGIYWEPRYPRLVTKAWLKDAYGEKEVQRLKVIGDITCDLEGSIECNVQTTKSDNPVYVYNPLTEKIQYGVEGNGPVVLAVDKLPTELPREASETFGNSLLPFVPALAAADYQAPFEQLQIPEEFKRALIAHRGKLTPSYKYLQKYLHNK